MVEAARVMMQHTMLHAGNVLLPRGHVQKTLVGGITRINAFSKIHASHSGHLIWFAVLSCLALIPQGLSSSKPLPIQVVQFLKVRRSTWQVCLLWQTQNPLATDRCDLIKLWGAFFCKAMGLLDSDDDQELLKHIVTLCLCQRTVKLCMCNAVSHTYLLYI